MTDVLREVAMTQYGKLEYPVTHEELYCAGFEAGAKYVYNALDALVSWKPEVEEGVVC